MARDVPCGFEGERLPQRPPRVPLWWRICEPFLLLFLILVWLRSAGTMWENEDEYDGGNHDPDELEDGAA